MSNFWAFLWEALMPDPISAAPNYPMWWCYTKLETTISWYDNFLQSCFLWYSKTYWCITIQDLGCDPMWCYTRLRQQFLDMTTYNHVFVVFQNILVHYNLKVWVVIVNRGMSYLGKHTNGSWHSKKYRVVAATLS